LLASGSNCDYDPNRSLGFTISMQGLPKNRTSGPKLTLKIRPNVSSPPRRAAARIASESNKKLQPSRSWRTIQFL
jgi:hypothetical protein